MKDNKKIEKKRMFEIVTRSEMKLQNVDAKQLISKPCQAWTNVSTSAYMSKAQTMCLRYFACIN